MKQVSVWKVGPTMRMIYSSLRQILYLVEQSADVYLSESFLSGASIQRQDWDLSDTDDYFACMTEERFAELRPSNPLEEMEPYEAADYPDSGPARNVWDLEDSGLAIEMWFQELQERKISVDGCGCVWPKGSSAWVPREMFNYEDLHCESSIPPSVPWRLSSAYYNNHKPHQIYHASHGDEGREGIILRSEIQILIRCMKGRMADPALCVHNVPVRLSLLLPYMLRPLRLI